jgi:hypothetical protein
LEERVLENFGGDVEGREIGACAGFVGVPRHVSEVGSTRLSECIDFVLIWR